MADRSPLPDLFRDLDEVIGVVQVAVGEAAVRQDVVRGAEIVIEHKAEGINRRYPGVQPLGLDVGYHQGYWTQTSFKVGPNGKYA